MRLVLILFAFEILFQPIRCSELNIDYEGVDVIPSIPLKNNSPIYSLVERLYIAENTLPPSYGFISTAHDIHQSLNNIQYVKDNSSNAYNQSLIDSFYSQYALNKLKNKLSTWIDCSIGIDYLYRKTKVVMGEDSTYYSRFKDADFINRYDDKWNLFDLSFQAAYNNRYFFSYRFGLKEYWKELREKVHGIPKNLLEMDNNFNQQSIFIANFNKFKFFYGKTKYSIGLGESGKLFLSDQSTALDAVGFSLNQNGKLVLHHITAIIDNITDDHLRETEPPKYLFIHRLEINPLKRFRVGLTELLLINSYMKWQYMNPFKIYHNVSNFASTNVISAIDAEILVKKNLILYGTFAIDELDVDLVEQDFSQKDKSSLAYQFGLKYYEIFHIPATIMILEYIQLDKWFYNHYAGNLGSDRDLTITHTESVPYPEGVEIYTRHLGYTIGGNSETIYIKFIIKCFTLEYQYSELGEPLMFQIPFQDISVLNAISEVFEYRNIIGIRYSNQYINEHLGIQLSAHLFQVKNYHNIAKENKTFPEINIKVNYKFDKWDLSL